MPLFRIFRASTALVKVIRVFRGGTWGQGSALFNHECDMETDRIYLRIGAIQMGRQNPSAFGGV